jgi:hypothetical protein
LKKLLVLLSILVLVVGLVVTIEAVITIKKTATIASSWQSVRDTEWEISGNFTAGNALNFSITPGDNWALFAERPPPNSPIIFNYVTVYAYIIDPNGGKANFSYIYAQAGQEQTYLTLIPFGVVITSNDGGISMQDTDVIAEDNQTVYYAGIQGIVKYNGTYRAGVDKVLPSPPRYLYLYRKILSIDTPYLFATPLGGLAIGTGAILLAYGLRKPKRVFRGKIGKQ